MCTTTVLLVQFSSVHSTGKAKLVNGNLIGEGHCLTWENFLVTNGKDF